MSYDCWLVVPVTKKELTTSTKHEIAGGTYAVGGTCELWFNITCNYSEILYKVLPDGVLGLQDISAADSIPILEQAITKLGDDVDSNYWVATEGNVKRALYGLLALAKLRPDGMWKVDW